MLLAVADASSDIRLKKILSFLPIAYVLYAVIVAWSMMRVLFPIWRAHANGQLASADVQWLRLATFTALCVAFIAIFVWLARLLSKRRRRTRAIILAACSCLAIPLGTILGAVTIFALTRPEVRNEFELRE